MFASRVFKIIVSGVAGILGGVFTYFTFSSGEESAFYVSYLVSVPANDPTYSDSKAESLIDSSFFDFCSKEILAEGIEANPTIASGESLQDNVKYGFSIFYDSRVVYFGVFSKSNFEGLGDSVYIICDEYYKRLCSVFPEYSYEIRIFTFDSGRTYVTKKADPLFCSFALFFFFISGAIAYSSFFEMRITFKETKVIN